MTENTEIIVLTGKGAVGKSSLTDYLVENGQQKVLKMTTREPRPDEVDGQDYRFVSYDDFINDETMQVVTRIGYNLYGINKQALEQRQSRSIVTLDVDGILQLEKAVNPENIRVMMIEAPSQLVIQRMQKSGESLDSIRVMRREGDMKFSEERLSQIKSPIFKLDGSLDTPDLAKQMFEQLKRYESNKLAQKMAFLNNQKTSS